MEVDGSDSDSTSGDKWVSLAKELHDEFGDNIFCVFTLSNSGPKRDSVVDTDNVPWHTVPVSTQFHNVESLSHRTLFSASCQELI